MRTRKWKRNPPTYVVTRAKTSHTSHHLAISCQTSTQLIALQHEQMSASGNLAQQYPLTPRISLIADDDDDEVLTRTVGNQTQKVPYVPNRRPHHLQLCQLLTHIWESPESATPKNYGQPNLFWHYDLLDTPTTSAYPLPSFSRLIAGLQNMTLHAHIEKNAYITGCLVCAKPSEQVIEATVVKYLHQTAEPRESIKDRVLKRDAFVDGLQSGVFTSFRLGVSQAAGCDGQVYTVNYDNPQSGTQTKLLLLFED